MKRIIPYIVMLVLTVGFTITAVPSILRRQNIFIAAEKRDANQIVIDMHDDPNPKSYGNELRIKAISVNDELLDLGEISNDNWVWHPEWGYIQYQQGDSAFIVNIDHNIDSLKLTLIGQEGSGRCTVSLNGIAEKNYDMYGSNWHETIYSVQYVNELYLIYLSISFGVIIFILFFGLYRFFMYLLGMAEYQPQKIGVGAFDFAKGLGIILVILGHSIQDVSSENAYISADILVAVVAIILMYAILPMFFIMSGYGSSAANSIITIKKQVRVLIEFYGIYVMAVIVVDAVKVFIMHDLSRKDLIKQIAGFFTLTIHDTSVSGFEIASMGPMWFFASLCIGKVLLNGVLMVKSRKLQALVIALTLIPFYCLIKRDYAFFCLAPVCSTLIFLYVGHCLSKFRLFRIKSNYVPLAFIFGTIIFYIAAFLNGPFFSISGNCWGNNIFLGLFISAIGGMVLTWLCLEYGNTIFRKCIYIRKIGRMSAFFFWAHSIEYMVIPWKELMRQINMGMYVKGIIIFVLRMIIVVVLTAILMFVYKLLHKKRDIT